MASLVSVSAFDMPDVHLLEANSPQGVLRCAHWQVSTRVKTRAGPSVKWEAREMDTPEVWAPFLMQERAIFHVQVVSNPRDLRFEDIQGHGGAAKMGTVIGTCQVTCDEVAVLPRSRTGHVEIFLPMHKYKANQPGRGPAPFAGNVKV